MPSLPYVATLLLAAVVLNAGESTSVSQYGITWTFAKPVQVGRFITGDWWVVGPVQVVAVTPEPGPARQGAKDKAVKSRYGATGMEDNPTLRNGSMIVEQSGGKQGYDSRPVNFDAALTVTYPLELKPGVSLISTISNQGEPYGVLLKDIMWRSEATGNAALQVGAVLTCLDAAPPADAFRPPYAGTDKPIFLASRIHWDRLPKLAPPAGGVPDWAMVERWFERPWLDHIASWVFQLTGPQENQANYGREFCRSVSFASLMLMLDVPQERKHTLMIRFLQRGIDCYGLISSGRRWSADGGHWNGRKLPLLFAGILLDDKRLTDALAAGLFSEDQQTYYGTGFTGETALYQMVFHTGPKPPYEEKDPKTWDDADKRSNSYRHTCSVGWPGMALATLWLQGKAAWNHDAFFDYADRWMQDPKSGGLPDNGRCDRFVQAMWDAHRASVPPQPGGTAHLKWDWQKKEFGPNRKPEKP
jgi:hypothetical protein